MRVRVLLLLMLALTGWTLTKAGVSHVAAQTNPSQTAVPTAGSITYVAGSVQKVCQLTGETDRQTNQPTMSQTESRFGLQSADLGYSFDHDGKLFFLFADTKPTAKFNGQKNLVKDPPRIPDDNDAIAYATDTSLDPCVKLNFITNSIGAYKNPVVLNAQGQPAITLRVDEIPISGISDGGKMYVIFGTDNYVYPTPGPSQGNLGFGTRTVVGESDDDANTFHDLYDFSKGSGAKFINVAIAQSSDGYLYFWGTQGGTLWRHSAVYLARKPIGSMGSLNPIQYLQTVNPDGTPVFSPNESDATAMFHDMDSDNKGQEQVTDCMGELGVQWNSYVQSWVMLYNCADQTASNVRGIYMRVAAHPWGPWSAPQTIFNPTRDNAYCAFIFRPNSTPPCTNLADDNKTDVIGGVYGPYFINRFTSGDQTKGTSTIYYTMATWNPYGQVIMKTTIQRSS